MNKRGISAIVTTVLIILITVSAVAIVWVAIIPMINDALVFSELKYRVSIISSKGYTVYDSNKELAIVQVKRDVDDGSMDSIRIFFTIDGDSVSSLVLAPDSGDTKTYSFDLSGYGEPDSVSIAPIFVIGNSEKEGAITSEVKMPKNSISNIKGMVYNIGRDYTDIPTNGLVSWWSFNGNVQDNWGNNDGTINGADCNTQGKYGRGCKFYSASDYINVNPDILSDANEVTISAWINLDTYATTSQSTIISDRVGNLDFHLVIFPDDTNPHKLLFTINTSVGTLVSSVSSSDIPLNSWTHVVGRYDGSNVEVYIDGVQDGSINSTSGTITSNSNEIKIGSFGADNNIFNGTIDDVMIFSRALSSEEITAIYES